MKYEPRLISNLLKTALLQKTCMKHSVAVVIETPDKKYVLGWNGVPTKGAEHDKCLREGYTSGEGMHLCPAVHAERRAISHAARDGICLNDGVIYLSEWFPCADCAKSIIEAGLVKLVTPDEFYNDKKNHVLTSKLQNQPYNFEMAEKLIREAGIEIIVDPFIKPK